MKSIGIIRPAQTETITAEGDTFDEAKAALEAVVPEGWQLLAVRYER
jgi:hypothetical protein